MSDNLCAHGVLRKTMCARCGEPIDGRRPNAKYCSIKHRAASLKARYRAKKKLTNTQ